MIWLIFPTILTILISILFSTNRSNRLRENGIIHKKPLPIVGNSAALLLRKVTMTDFVQNIYNLHETAKYVGFFEFGVPVIMIRDPDLWKNLTIKNFDHFMDHRAVITSDQEPLFGRNLLSLRGEKWREMRNRLSPAFTSSKMRTMFKLMSDYAANFTDFLANSCDRTIDSKEAFSKYTNDVIGTCAFGVSVDSMRNPENEFYVLGKEIVNFNFWRMMKFFAMMNYPRLTKILGFRIFDEKMEAFFMELVRSTIETRDREGITRPDMVQLMMENTDTGKARMSIEDMTAQAFLFFIAGFETTATLMCFVAHLIAAHPLVQKRLQEEVDKISDECNGCPTYEALKGMKYLDAVINEVARLYPIMPIMDRICTKAFTLPPALPGKNPVLLKPGESILMAVYPLHRDPDHFPSPDEFSPERFLQNPNLTNSPAYMPFGIGPRMCIGNRFALLEVKVLIFHLIAKCSLAPGENMILPLELDRKSMVMKPKGGFWLSLEPRGRKS